MRVHPITRLESRSALQRLLTLAARFGLKNSEICYLLDLDRRTVNKWKSGERLCPLNAPEMLRSILEIRSPAEWRAEIAEKRKRITNEALNVTNEAPD